MTSSAKTRPPASGRPVKEKQTRRRAWQVGATVAAALAVVAAVAMAAFAGGNGADRADYTAAKEGFVLPGLLDDKPVSLSAHAGQPVVVNFFASWCVYCNEELPGFAEVARATDGEVSFIGVNTADPGDGADMARRFELSDAGFALASDVGADPGSDLWRGLGGQGLPVTAFYDAQGRLVDFAGGMLTQQQLEQRIQKNFGIEVDATDAAGEAAPVIPLIPRGAYELISRKLSEDPQRVTILDVRTPEEYAGGRLPQAVNVDWYDSTFDQQVADLDKDKSYFVYCRTGSRSAQATERLHSLGFKHVYDLTGGITAWQAEGLPVVG